MNTYRWTFVNNRFSRRTFRHPHWRPAEGRRVACAPHIRGRVFKRGDLWHMEVVNTATGEVLARDNTGAWGPLDVDADRTTAAARIAWIRGFGNKAVQR